MLENIPEGKGGFIIVLYKILHIRDLKSCPKFGIEAARRFREDYSPERIEKICSGILWAIDHENVDYKNILPGMRHENDEILWFFRKTLKEMAEVGLCCPNKGQ